MAIEAYRVLRRFGWGGWTFAPKTNACQCVMDGGGQCGTYRGCTGKVGTTCGCKVTTCRCSCGIRKEDYAGDVWLVEAGHPRKAAMLAQRFAVYDGALPPAEQLAGDKHLQRLLGIRSG